MILVSMGIERLRKYICIIILIFYLSVPWQTPLGNSFEETEVNQDIWYDSRYLSLDSNRLRPK
jgi:hypothetical protein